MECREGEQAEAASAKGLRHRAGLRTRRKAGVTGAREGERQKGRQVCKTRWDLSFAP